MKLTLFLVSVWLFTFKSIAQVPLYSANPDFLYSTSNDYGVWGSPDYLYSFTNEYGPIGSPDSLTGVMNDYGLGLMINPVATEPSAILGDASIEWTGLLVQPIEPIFEFVEVPFQVLDGN